MTKKPAATDTELQLRRYRAAVDAIGGIRAHARAIGFSERHGRRYYSGAATLHEGILIDTARALVAHADLCRTLERRLTPLMSANLTAEQMEKRGEEDRRRYNSEGDDGKRREEYALLERAIASQKIRKCGDSSDG